MAQQRAFIGSSPRAWGTRCRADHLDHRRRFIPTSVGNTSSRRISAWLSPVHPHERGEHEVAQQQGARAYGSSPRAWGTHPPCVDLANLSRFIPTSVGNTSSTTVRNWRAAVHPHERGEHPHAVPIQLAVGGSSPRAWGTRDQHRVTLAGPRFIPTSVGNTVRTAPSGALRTVHPHERGEHAVNLGVMRHSIGSSPRAWGTRVLQKLRNDADRFIPTSVGNTAPARPGPQCRPVHPHERGEHMREAGAVMLWPGSSPRAWGTHSRPKVSRPDHRFIPTSVGNTLTVAASEAAPAVHPHERGEHFFTSAVTVVSIGSSPRAWGTRLAAHSEDICSRFIPTSVGNTIPARSTMAWQSVHPHERGEHAGQSARGTE